MNGVHDMGGMQGLGELHYARDDRAFHESWELRVHALTVAMAAHGKWRVLRPKIEAIPAAEQLRMQYYERWLAALLEQTVDSGLATRAELERGRADSSAPRASPALTGAAAGEVPLRAPRTELNLDVAPRFAIGQTVRGRNLHPTTHTRMPRYTRGRVGVVERDRGVFALPDTDVYFLDPKPQHVYLVRFAARELWGEDAPARDSVYIDLWEDYLEPT
ncbi:MAG TPA: nitrile hydratase subunit beta [Gammaproteobacteria bacterium]|nr:nitrile hydratase subunit beta [Gammaproteobacteria bacterium]